MGGYLFADSPTTAAYLDSLGILFVSKKVISDLKYSMPFYAAPVYSERELKGSE